MSVTSDDIRLEVVALGDCPFFPAGMTEGHTITAFKGFLFLYAGFKKSDEAFGSVMLKYDIGEQVWCKVKRKAACPCLQCPRTFLCGSSIFFVGGYHVGGDNKINQDVWIFDCRREDFKKAPFRVEGDHVEKLGGSLAVGGGRLFSLVDGCLWEMNLRNGKWRRRAKVSGCHPVKAMAWSNGCVYFERFGKPLVKYDVESGNSTRLQQSRYNHGYYLCERSQTVSDGKNELGFLTLLDGGYLTASTFDTSREDLGWAASKPSKVSRILRSLPKEGSFALFNGSLYVFVGEAVEKGGGGREHFEALFRIDLVRSAKPIREPSGDLATSLTGDLARMLLTASRDADVKFLVGSEKKAVYGHNLIISCRCPKLSGLVKKAKPSEEVELPNVCFKTFWQVLKFIYTGAVDDSGSLRSKILLLEASKSFELLQLGRVCEEMLRSSPTTGGSLIDGLTMSFGLGLASARKIFIQGIVRHEAYLKIVSSSKFSHLDPKLIVEIVQEHGRLRGEGPQDASTIINQESPASPE